MNLIYITIKFLHDKKDTNKTNIRPNVPIGVMLQSLHNQWHLQNIWCKATVEQITALHFAGADIYKSCCSKYEAALALKEIKSQVDLPLVADIHFHYKLALIAAEVVDCIELIQEILVIKKSTRSCKACQRAKYTY